MERILKVLLTILLLVSPAFADQTFNRPVTFVTGSSLTIQTAVPVTGLLKSSETSVTDGDFVVYSGASGQLIRKATSFEIFTYDSEPPISSVPYWNEALNPHQWDWMGVSDDESGGTSISLLMTQRATSALVDGAVANFQALDGVLALAGFSSITGTLGVANGGTGDTSLTAYAPVFGGTTSTGALQSGTVGTAGQILTSNGAGALPTFQAAPSSGAPTTATYITETANGSLSAEFALGSLATGILKNTTTTGVPSIATEGTDYYGPGGTDVAVTDGGTGASSASSARTNLGATTVGANLFTLTNPGAITFLQVNADNTVTAQNAAAQRTAIGATTVGGNLFTLTNPSAISFARINADNTVTARTGTQVKSDLNLTIGTDVEAWDTDLDTWALTTPPSSYAVGDLIYASAANTLSKLADVATGSVLVSGGVTTAPAYSSTPTLSTLTLSSTTSLLLGTAGSAVGNIGFRNATSGTATLAPPTGALGTYNVTLPNAASTLPIFGQQVTVSGPTAARTWTAPDASFTIARTDAANSFTGVQSMTSPDVTTSITTPSATFAIANATATTLNLGAAASIAINIGNAAGTNTILGFNVMSTSGAASAPSLKVSGVPFAGTGTTSFPLVYINDANATASTTLNTAGTYLGVNGDGTQDLFNFLKDGTSRFKLDSVGTGTIVTTEGAGKAFDIISANTGQTYMHFANTSVHATQGWQFAMMGSAGGFPKGFYLYDEAASGYRQVLTSSSTTPAVQYPSSMTIGWTNAGNGTGSNDTGMSRNTAGVVEINNGTAGTYRDLQSRNVLQSGKTTTYNNIATEGNGMGAIVKATRVTAQTAANSSIATYTTPASDGSYLVSGNLNVSAAVALSTSLNCDYTDETNTARTMIIPISGLAGTFLAGGLATSTGPFESSVMHIRTKASTAITIYTAAGTFSSVTYTAEGIIRQVQ